MAKCQRCGYEWEPRTEKPKECPACKSYKWLKPVSTTSTRRRQIPSFHGATKKRAVKA